MIDGFKGYFKEDEVMLGPELCFYLGVDFEEVLQRLKGDQDANKEYFMGQIGKIQNGLPKEEYFAEIDRKKKRGITDAQMRLPEVPPEQQDL